MIGRLVFITALLATSMVWAQETDAPATVGEIAAAKAHADAVMDRNDARPFFINVTRGEVPLVRHVASGLTCAFNVGDPRDTIAFYTQGDDPLARGEDVSCASWRDTTYVSLFATRYPEAYSADQLFAAAVQDIRRNWQNVAAVDGEFPVATIGDQDVPLAAVFAAERGDLKRQTMVVLHNIGPWSFKARATGEPGDTELPMAGSLAFALALPGGWEAAQP